MEPGWQAKIGAFDALSIKIADGTRSDFRRGQAVSVLNDATAAGVERHAWGYHYCRTEEAARREGFAAGKAASSVGAACYYMNLEKHWAGVWGSPRTDDPEGAALAFIGAFDDATCGDVGIAWNGFARESVWKGRRFCTERVLSRCSAWVPMCYGSIHRRNARAAKWRGRLDGIVHGAMVASGRLNREGRPTIRQTGRRSLDRFLDEVAPDMCAVWYGSGARGMLTEGNRINRPWCEYIRDRIERGGCGVD